MKPILSADGEEIGWLNYKTGKKSISFKMDADSRQAIIAVVLHHPDSGQRQLLYEHFLQLKGIFEEAVGEQDWVWSPDTADEHGRSISTIEKQLTGVNIFKNEDWPAVISFLKPRIIALDDFWSLVRFQFSGF